MKTFASFPEVDPVFPGLPLLLAMFTLFVSPLAALVNAYLNTQPPRVTKSRIIPRMIKSSAPSVVLYQSQLRKPNFVL